MSAETERFIDTTTTNQDGDGDGFDPRSIVDALFISVDFKNHLLFYCIRYSSTLNILFRDADEWANENIIDIRAAFDIRNEEGAVCFFFFNIYFTVCMQIIIIIVL